MPVTSYGHTCTKYKAMENAISIAGHIETTLRNNQTIRETLANNLPTTTMYHTTPQSYAYTFTTTTPMSKHAFLAALTQATSQHYHLHDIILKHFYYTTNLNSTTPSTLNKHRTMVTVLNLLLRVLAHPTSPQPCTGNTFNRSGHNNTSHHKGHHKGHNTM